MSAFRTAPIFSNSMVLQRNKNINVFGTGTDGDRITVEFEGSTAFATVKNGEWLAVLPPRAEGENLTMTVSCGNEKITFTDIVMGEVWLAGGQSNMEFELQNCKTGQHRLKNDVTPNVRFYYTPKIVKGTKDYEEKMTKTCWSKFDSESAKAWSAVGYIFAKELADKLGCTVGVIGCNWGGTKASHWMSEESLLKDEDMRYDLDEFNKAIEGKSQEELTRIYLEYEDYNNKWEEKKNRFYAENPNGSWEDCIKVCGECAYPGPLVPLNAYHATALYESMIKRVCPYTLAGFTYYQGESDDNRPFAYYKLLRGLITLWRDDWGDDELPFIIVQLPMHRYGGDPDYKHWCIIREAQEKAFHTIKNTGLAVIIDCGEFNEIHPKDKEPVGHRVALQILSAAYGDRNPENLAPLYKSHIETEGGLLISFENQGGFRVTGEKCGFEIAGEDKEYKPADFEIRGDRIFVFNKDIPEPKNVRYLWTNYGDVTLYGASGLPVAPFRTDKSVDK